MKNFLDQKRIAVLLIVILLACAPVLMANATEYVAVEELRDHRSEAERQTYFRLVDAWAETLKDEEADVVFLGDSITAMGKWDEYFEDDLVENFGVSADHISDVQMRLVLVEMLEPSKCFLMIGVNDLRRTDASKEQIVIAYENLLAELDEISAEIGMMVYVQSILPVRGKTGTTNEAIRALNEEIEKLADLYQMTFIDIHSVLTDESGQLRQEYTSDGLHLYPNAYQVWCEALIPYLEES